MIENIAVIVLVIFGLYLLFALIGVPIQAKKNRLIEQERDKLYEEVAVLKEILKKMRADNE